MLHTFATTHSALMKKRVARYMVSATVPLCHGKRLRPEALSVKFAGSTSPRSRSAADERWPRVAGGRTADGKSANAARRQSCTRREADGQRSASRAAMLVARLDVLIDLGLGYLSLDRSTPTLSPGELQRLRLATQMRSNLFGVVYVLDEPSAGLHPGRYRGPAGALDQLKRVGQLAVRR